MKKIYFLIGLNKTGTTYLRSFIKKNKNLNLNYLNVSKKIWKIIKTKNQNKKKIFIKSLKKLVDKSDNKIVLINCEDQLIPFKTNYYYPNLVIIKKLFNNAEFLITFRRQDEWIISFFKETFINRDYNITFNEFVKKLNLKLLDFYFLHKFLNKNKFKFKIFFYENFKKNNKKYIQNFLKAIKVTYNKEKLLFPAKENPSFSNFSIYLTYFLNKIINLKKIKFWNNFIKKYFDKLIYFLLLNKLPNIKLDKKNINYFRKCNQKLKKYNFPKDYFF